MRLSVRHALGVGGDPRSPPPLSAHPSLKVAPSGARAQTRPILCDEVHAGRPEASTPGEIRSCPRGARKYGCPKHARKLLRDAAPNRTMLPDWGASVLRYSRLAPDLADAGTARTWLGGGCLRSVARWPRVGNSRDASADAEIDDSSGSLGVNLPVRRTASTEAAGQLRSRVLGVLSELVDRTLRLLRPPCRVFLRAARGPGVVFALEVLSA